MADSARASARLGGRGQWGGPDGGNGLGGMPSGAGAVAIRARAVAEAPGKPVADAKLVSALSAALERGPKDAAAMMLQGPAPQGVGDVGELDALARSHGTLAGMAAYDAAMILELVPPRTSDPKYFKDLATRYDRAALLLTDPALKKLARERAIAARATHKKHELKRQSV